MSWSCPLPFLSIPPSCPCHFLGMSASFPCIFLSFIASHFPTSSFVYFGFVVLCLPCTPPVFISFPFMSLSVPLRFPFIRLLFLSCQPLGYPLSSLKQRNVGGFGVGSAHLVQHKKTKREKPEAAISEMPPLRVSAGDVCFSNGCTAFLSFAHWIRGTESRGLGGFGR